MHSRKTKKRALTNIPSLHKIISKEYLGADYIGVIRTDKWLEADFHQPLKICNNFLDEFDEKYPQKIYQYLSKYGMYQPNRSSLRNFEQLLGKDYWKLVNKQFQRYRRLWNGPDIPIYIFPINAGSTFGMNGGRRKSGVSFEDKMFLFLSPFDDEKEIEALFVHEYHHVCRLNKINKKISDYTLLDSIVLEGLAEHAVKENCGEKYLAKWCSKYSEKQLNYYWEKLFKHNLKAKHEDTIHDRLLFGQGSNPPLIGYAIGYYIVSKYIKNNRLSIKSSFNLPAQKFTKDQ